MFKNLWLLPPQSFQVALLKCLSIEIFVSGIQKRRLNKFHLYIPSNYLCTEFLCSWNVGVWKWDTFYSTVTSSAPSKGVFWVNIHIQAGTSSQAHKNVTIMLGYPNIPWRNGLYLPKTSSFLSPLSPLPSRGKAKLKIDFNTKNCHK